MDIYQAVCFYSENCFAYSYLWIKTGLISYKVKERVKADTYKTVNEEISTQVIFFSSSPLPPFFTFRDMESVKILSLRATLHEKWSLFFLVHRLKIPYFVFTSTQSLTAELGSIYRQLELYQTGTIEMSDNRLSSRCPFGVFSGNIIDKSRRKYLCDYSLICFRIKHEDIAQNTFA